MAVILDYSFQINGYMMALLFNSIIEICSQAQTPLNFLWVETGR